MSVAYLQRKSKIVQVRQKLQIGTEELNRLRWLCRRGLFVLDVVLGRFLEKHRDHHQGERLSSSQTLLPF